MKILIKYNWILTISCYILVLFHILLINMLNYVMLKYYVQPILLLNIIVLFVTILFSKTRRYHLLTSYLSLIFSIIGLFLSIEFLSNSTISWTIFSEPQANLQDIKKHEEIYFSLHGKYLDLEKNPTEFKWKTPIRYLGSPNGYLDVTYGNWKSLGFHPNRLYRLEIFPEYQLFDKCREGALNSDGTVSYQYYAETNDNGSGFTAYAILFDESGKIKKKISISNVSEKTIVLIE